MERTRRAVLVGADTTRLLALADELEARGLEVALFRDAERGIEACESGRCDVLVAIGRLAPRDGVPPQRVSVPLVLLDAPDAPDLPLRPIGPRTALGASTAPAAAAERVIALLARAPDVSAPAPSAANAPAPPAPAVALPASPPPAPAPPLLPMQRAAPSLTPEAPRAAPVTPQDWGAGGTDTAQRRGIEEAVSRPAEPPEQAVREPDAPRRIPTVRTPEPPRTVPAERVEVVRPAPAAERQPSPERAAPGVPAARSTPEPATGLPSDEPEPTGPPWWEESAVVAPVEPEAPVAAARGPADRVSSLRRTIADTEDAAPDRVVPVRVGLPGGRPTPRRGSMFSNVLLILAGIALGFAIGFIVLGLFGMR